jgi:hypothetical protein
VATVTYRCQVSPDQCPTSPTPGWCSNHPTSALRRERRGFERPAATREDPPPPQDQPAQAPQPERQRPQVALRLLGEQIEVPPDGMELGRDAPRSVDLPGMSDLLQVSRHHARLFWRGSILYVEDLSSRNGTYVDGERVVEPRPLLAGQALRLADVGAQVVELTFDQYGLPR